MTDRAAALAADLLAELVRQYAGALGVLARDIPLLEPEPVLRALLAVVEEGLELRVAYLRSESVVAAREFGYDEDHFSAEVEQAERWRNQRHLTGLIVVIASGDQAKLTSLEDFHPITSADLKRELVKRALAGQAGANDVQARWWRILGEDERVSLGQMVAYHLALEGLSDQEYKVRSSRELHRLGLLPDPALFDNPAESTIRRRLDDNRELVRRLQILTEKDRRVIASNIAAETTPDQRERLRRSNARLRALRRGAVGLEELTVTDAQGLLGIRTAKKPPPQSPSPAGGGPPPPPPAEKEKLIDLAASALLDETDGLQELDQTIDQVVDELAKISDRSARTEQLTVTAESGLEFRAEVRGDLINVVSRVVDEDLYGCLARTEGTEITEILRRFRAEQDVYRRWNRADIEGFLGSFDHRAMQAVGEAFRRYSERRTAVLGVARLLCVEPMAVAAAPSRRRAMLEYIDAYRVLFEELHSAYPDLVREYGSEIDEFVAYLLALETIVFRRDDALLLLVAPTHPLFLWHYAEYARVVSAQRDRLTERDRRLVVEGAAVLPNFLTSICVPFIAAETSRSLPQIGFVGPLPYYGQAQETNARNDGIGLIRRIATAFMDLHPPSRFGLRLVVIDPPDAGTYLSLCREMSEKEGLEGAMLAVLRHPRRARAAEMHLDEDEEERIASLFRATSADRRFVFDTRQLPDGDVAVPEGILPHIVVAFDQAQGRPSRAQPFAHPIQPLALTRRLRYRVRTKTVELEPAPGGIFAAYDSVVGYFDKSAQSSYFSTHQEEDLRVALRDAAAKVPWYVVADRSVDRDLHLGRLRVFTGREESRDVVAFASSSDAFRRALRDVVRQYNTAISDAELDGLLDELSELLDEGVLGLRPDRNGRANDAAVKGLLGTLVAARWYRRQATPAHERLLVSLDGPNARRWLHLSPDPRRADLVGFSVADGRFALDIIEVKTRQDPAGEYRVEGGVASGPAIDQLLSTRGLLMQVFADDRADELITTPARREVLREHVYRELSKRTYTPDERKMWVERLEQLFEGSGQVTPRCHLVEVRLGVDDASLQSREARMRDGAELVPVWITELNETGVEALRQRAPEPSGTPATPEQDDSGARILVGTAARPSRPDEPPAAPPAAPAPEVVEEAPLPVAGETQRPRAYLGEAPGPYGRPRQVWFDPELPGQPLPNPHVAITGETGSGKTQAIKAMLRDLREVGLPVLILDFKDDYSQPEYAKVEGLDVYNASFGGLPFNPMVPPVDPQSERVALMNHVHQLGEIVKRIYGLGDQQAYRLREALKDAYDSQGLRMQPFAPAEGQKYPSFDEVHAILRRGGKDNEALLGRLSPIFDLSLFASEQPDAAFTRLVEQSAVIRLSQLPGDEVKNAVAEFFLMALYNHLIRQRHPHALRRLLVLDEAWRLVESPFLEPLMREGRAFGLGVILASQFPKDLPPVIAGSAKTHLYFSQAKPENVREVQKALTGKTTGADAEHIGVTVRGLPPLTCLMQNSQYSPYARVAVVPYYTRFGTEHPNQG
jgi:hypothetical protein